LYEVDVKSQKEINKEYICEYCHEIVANGVGPSGLKKVTTILNTLPSSHVFYRSACQHDKDYHKQIGKKLADYRFLTDMKRRSWEKYPVVERRHWYSWFNPKKALSAVGTSWSFTKRRGLIASAYRNYYFVKFGGDSAYKEGACKKLISIIS
jgi:hypothetical protein